MDIIKEEIDYIPSSAQQIYIKNTNLTLVPISMPKEYAKEWNVHGNDYLGLCKNGKLISNTYYRKGGLFNNKGYDFIHIIKHVEELYHDSITTDAKRKKHLASYFCLINKEGQETKVFEQFDNSYLLCNAVYNSKYGYFNTFTNELYCKGTKSIDSTNYLFLESSYSTPENKRGVYKIDKQTGEFELFQ